MPVAALGDALTAATDGAGALPSFDAFFGDDLQVPCGCAAPAVNAQPLPSPKLRK
jgi:hypothetical protein